LSRPVGTAVGNLSMSHHQFLVIDPGVSFPSDFSRASLNGLVWSEPGVAVVLTGIHSGLVRVRVNLYSSVQGVDVEGWDDVAEVSLEAPFGHVVASGMASDPPAELPELTPQGPGTYRLRVHVRGRDTAVDLVAEEPVEEYLLSVWPADPGPPVAYKLTDSYGAGIRGASS